GRDPPARVVRGHVGDPLALDLELAAIHAVLLAVETEVERGSEIEARLAHDLDLDRRGLAVQHVEVDPPAEQAARVVVVAELRPRARDPLLLAARVVPVARE